MDRREFLGLGTVTLTAAATTGLGVLSKAWASPEDSQHSLIVQDAKVLVALKLLQVTTAACVTTGQSCIQHCQEQLSKGETDFKNCTIAVHQMVVLCQAVGTLAAYKATVLEKVLEGCIEACKACEAACKEHEKHFSHGMHLECKACMESCKACKEQCEYVLKLIKNLPH